MGVQYVSEARGGDSTEAHLGIWGRLGAEYVVEDKQGPDHTSNYTRYKAVLKSWYA